MLQILILFIQYSIQDKLLNKEMLMVFAGRKMGKNKRYLFTKPMQIPLFDENDDGSLKEHKKGQMSQ